MGYFKRPIRRSTSRKSKLAFLEPSRHIRPTDWRLCDPAALPARGSADTYLRFVVELPRLGRVGLFQSSDHLEDDPDLPPALRSQLRAAFRWFNTNLPVARRLPKNAVCWFRADANASLRRLRTIIEIYRLMGWSVWMQATSNAGRIVYRDDYQVAAVPYRDRRTTSSRA